MRIIVFSDTHQNTALLQLSVQQAIEDGTIDVFIHCGDGVRDITCVEDVLRSANPRILIYAVRGNCDLGMFLYPIIETIELSGIRMMITHGHTFQVKHGLGKLAKAASEIEAKVAFFGHTHQPTITEKHGISLVNPGALASYSLTDTAYLEITINHNQNIRKNFIKQRLKDH